MKNKLVVLMLASTLITPAGLLWATAGDASTQGAGATTTGQPAAKVKKHGMKHHKKAPKTTAATASQPAGK